MNTMKIPTAKQPSAKAPNQMGRPGSWHIEYDESVEFPIVEIGLGLTAQLMWITTQVAKEWLDTRAKQQRPIRHYHLGAIVDDLDQGRFLLNGQPVIFDWDGYMIDGQHRCFAVISSGKPALTLVIRGVSPDAYTTLDNTTKRTGADALRIKDAKNATVLASALRIMGVYQLGLLGKKTLCFSPTKIEELSTQHPKMPDSVTALNGARDLGSRATLAFCHYVFSSVDSRDAETFFNHLLDGTNLEKGSPILALRSRLYRTKTDSYDMIASTFKAWNAWRVGKHVTLIRVGVSEELPTPH